MDDSVLMYRDYGEIVFDLKSIMDKKDTQLIML